MLGVGIGLGVGEFIGRRPGLAPKLDLNFASTKSLTASKGPTPSFSRASTGSYFDGSGVLRYAALNILTYSEDFTNAVWTKTNATITANAILSPDGKLTADKISEDSASAKHRAYVTPSVTVGTIYTFSVYAKSAERNWLAMNYADTNANMYAYFNLQNGTIGSIDPSLTASITSVGNGWYRCSVTKTLAVAGPNFDVGPTTGDGVFSYTGTTGNGIYVWGAQLEASSTVGTYCPTTSSANSTPRFDHTFNGTSWVSRGLLVEEQRTNICLQSNTFNTTWLTVNGTVTANAATSPDGTNNAWKLNETSANSASHGIYQPLTIGTGNYTWSVYAKAGERSWLQFLAYSSLINYFTWFNLANGTVGTNAAGTTASIQDVGGGWYRCSVSRSTSAGTSYAQIFAANADNNGSYAGDPTKGIYIYGCQVEAGSFPTSYIGTTTSSVTRSADVCQITGGDFSGFWNGTEGSFVTEYDRLFTPSSGSQWVWQIDDTTDSERFGLVYEPSAAPVGEQMFVIDGNSVQARVGTGGVVSGTPGKFASCYKVNDFAGTLNGSSVNTDTSGTLPTVTQWKIGYHSTFYLNGHIARLRYYRKRLPNATLQKLST